MSNYKKIYIGLILSAILIGSIFYIALSKRNSSEPVLTKGDISESVLINYTNSSGEEISALAIPGQVTLFVRPHTDPKLVKELVTSSGGSILDQISGVEIYLISVPDGAEANFIQEALKSDFVIYATPNLAMTTLPLTKKGSDYNLPDSSSQGDESLPATVCAITKKVIVIDKFKDRIRDDSNKAHGEFVSGVIESIVGDSDVNSKVITSYDVSGGCETSDDECNRGNTYVGKVNGEYSTFSALVHAMNYAKIRKEKIVINFSMGPEDKSKDGWKVFQEAILLTMSIHPWAKEGNVILNQSVGNDGININAPISKLRKRYAPVMDKNIVYYGSLKFNSSRRAGYTNFDPSLMYVPEPLEGLTGTSFATPVGSGTLLKAWEKNPCATSGQIIKTFKDVSCMDNRPKPCFLCFRPQPCVLSNPKETIEKFPTAIPEGAVEPAPKPAPTQAVGGGDPGTKKSAGGSSAPKPTGGGGGGSAPVATKPSGGTTPRPATSISCLVSNQSFQNALTAYEITVPAYEKAVAAAKLPCSNNGCAIVGENYWNAYQRLSTAFNLALVAYEEALPTCSPVDRLKAESCTAEYEKALLGCTPGQPSDPCFFADTQDAINSCFR